MKIRAMVLVNGGYKLRKGKGFSLREVIKAGIEPAQLYANGLRFDRRRKTLHDVNLKALSCLSQSAN